jgi:hypothetical protein
LRGGNVTDTPAWNSQLLIGGDLHVWLYIAIDRSVGDVVMED